jgi:hypothetical protein
MAALAAGKDARGRHAAAGGSRLQLAVTSGVRELLAPGPASGVGTASGSSRPARVAPAALRGGIGPRSPEELVTQLARSSARERKTAMTVLSAGLGNRTLARIVTAGNLRAAPNVGLARKPKTTPQRLALTPAQLEELAQWPDRAHPRWKQLGTLEQGAVLERMRRRYGQAFADEFRGHAQNGTADLDARAFPTDLRSPDSFIQLGFRIAERASYQVWLVHPTGRWRYLYGAIPITAHPPCDEGTVEAIKGDADDLEARWKVIVEQRNELRKMLEKQNPQLVKADPDYQELFDDYEHHLNELETDAETLSSEANSFAMSNPNCAQYSGVINDAVDRMTFGTNGQPGVGQLIVTEKTMPPPEGWLDFLRPSKVKEKQIPDHIRKRVPGLPTDPTSPTVPLRPGRGT